MQPGKILISLGFSLFISACGSNPIAVSRFPSSEINAPNTGIVILSTRTGRGCSWDTTRATVRERYTHKTVGDLFFDTTVWFTHEKLESDFKNHLGFVSAIQLPVGNYYFVSLHDPIQRIIPISKNDREAFGFEVRDGEVAYIGELYLDNNYSCAGGFRFEVRDHYERDIQFTSKQNPLLLKNTPVKRLMNPLGPVGGLR